MPQNDDLWQHASKHWLSPLKLESTVCDITPGTVASPAEGRRETNNALMDYCNN